MNEQQAIIDAVECDGYVFVSEAVLHPAELFALALRHGYGFLMEPDRKRRAGDHPLVAKVSTSEVVSSKVREAQEYRAQLAAARKWYDAEYPAEDGHDQVYPWDHI